MFFFPLFELFFLMLNTSLFFFLIQQAITVLKPIHR